MTKYPDMDDSFSPSFGMSTIYDPTNIPKDHPLYDQFHHSDNLLGRHSARANAMEPSFGSTPARAGDAPYSPSFGFVYDDIGGTPVQQTEDATISIADMALTSDGMILSLDFNQDSVADASAYCVDFDGDGQLDGIILDYNLDGSPDDFLLDYNADGTTDLIATDLNQDGMPDLYALDINGDGVPDIYAMDTNADALPDVCLTSDDLSALL